MTKAEKAAAAEAEAQAQAEAEVAAGAAAVAKAAKGKMLDRSKPFGTVHGCPGVGFSQNGKQFDTAGKLIK